MFTPTQLSLQACLTPLPPTVLLNRTPLLTPTLHCSPSSTQQPCSCLPGLTYGLATSSPALPFYTRFIFIFSSIFPQPLELATFISRFLCIYRLKTQLSFVLTIICVSFAVIFIFTWIVDILTFTLLGSFIKPYLLLNNH